MIKPEKVQIILAIYEERERHIGYGYHGVDNSTSAANRLIGEVVQSRRRPLLGPSPG